MCPKYWSAFINIDFQILFVINCNDQVRCMYKQLRAAADVMAHTEILPHILYMHKPTEIINGIIIDYVVWPLFTGLCTRKSNTVRYNDPCNTLSEILDLELSFTVCLWKTAQGDCVAMNGFHGNRSRCLEDALKSGDIPHPAREKNIHSTFNYIWAELNANSVLAYNREPLPLNLISVTIRIC